MDQDHFISELYKALSFALFHHGKVLEVRKTTNIPYIVHPVGVMQILIEHTDDVEIIQAGILHDILEDTDGTAEEIEQNFSTRVKNLVLGATEPDHASKSWEERKQHTIDYIEHEADMDVLFVICADKFHNFSSIVDDHKKIGESIWKRFNRGREQQKWYYQALSEAFLKRDSKNKLFLKFFDTVHHFFQD